MATHVCSAAEAIRCHPHVTTVQGPPAESTRSSTARHVFEYRAVIAQSSFLHLRSDAVLHLLQRVGRLHPIPCDGVFCSSV